MRVTERVARREEAKAASRRRSGRRAERAPRRWSVVEGDKGRRIIIPGMRLAVALPLAALSPKWWTYEILLSDVHSDPDEGRSTR